MPRKVFVAGEILTAADVNTNLMDQAVMVFDDATDRATAIPTPVEGMVTYLKDTDEVDKFDGSAFVPVGIAPAVLQVVQATKLDTFVTASATFTTVTGLSATITPSATTSKILILAQVSYGTAGATTGHGHFRLAGGNSSSFVGTEVGSRVAAVFGGRTEANNPFNLASGSIVFLDSPATTSATTYTVETRQAGTGSVFVNRSATDSNNDEQSRGASSITVIEVAV